MSNHFGASATCLSSRQRDYRQQSSTPVYSSTPAQVNGYIDHRETIDRFQNGEGYIRSASIKAPLCEEPSRHFGYKLSNEPRERPDYGIGKQRLDRRSSLVTMVPPADCS